MKWKCFRIFINRKKIKLKQFTASSLAWLDNRKRLLPLRIENYLLFVDVLLCFGFFWSRADNENIKKKIDNCLYGLRDPFEKC